MPTTVPSFLVWLLSQRKENSNHDLFSRSPGAREQRSVSCPSSTRRRADGIRPFAGPEDRPNVSRPTTNKSDELSAQRGSHSIRPRIGNFSAIAFHEMARRSQIDFVPSGQATSSTRRPKPLRLIALQLSTSLPMSLIEADVTGRVSFPKTKRPIASPPDGDGPKRPPKFACEKESIANHNPFLTGKLNSLRQIEKWPDSDRRSHKSA